MLFHFPPSCSAQWEWAGLEAGPGSRPEPGESGWERGGSFLLSETSVKVTLSVAGSASPEICLGVLRLISYWGQKPSLLPSWGPSSHWVLCHPWWLGQVVEVGVWWVVGGRWESDGFEMRSTV